MGIEQIVDKVIEKDVLVIGTEAAGGIAAIAASEGTDVLMVTKGVMGKSGVTIMAVATYTAPFADGDTPEMILRDMIVGGPKWIETQSFDIVAKVADASPYSPSWVPDHVRVMLRALLAERFKLATHTEERPVPVWSLVVGKSALKLTPADPNSRSGCKWSPGEMGTGSAAIPMDVQTCHNITMAQLAECLHAMDRGYVERPAVDMTGLKGGYDFVLSWVKPPVMAALRAESRAAGAAVGAIPEASDTASGITLFEAIEKLGLKLESGRKAPQPVIVIDQVEPLTADN